MNNEDVILVPVFCFVLFCFEAVPISKKYMQTQQFSSYPNVTQFAENVVEINIVETRRKLKLL